MSLIVSGDFIIRHLLRIKGLRSQQQDDCFYVATSCNYCYCGLPISGATGGIPAVTAMACIINAFRRLDCALADVLIKVFRLNSDPIGAGLGLGTAGHTVGSAKAVQLGSFKGAMASIAVVVISIVVDIVVPPFAHMMELCSKQVIK